jgi:hypothetical protein
MICNELRPMIEGVDMRGAARRVQKDDSIGLCDMVAVSGFQRILRSRLEIAAHASQSEGSESARCSTQKLATCL